MVKLIGVTKMRGAFCKRVGATPCSLVGYIGRKKRKIDDIIGKIKRTISKIFGRHYAISFYTGDSLSRGIQFHRHMMCINCPSIGVCVYGIVSLCLGYHLYEMK